MRRSLEQYKGAVPQAVADGSRAQVIYFIEDAQMDILSLYRALEQSQKALAMMVSPDAIMSSTVSNAYWEAMAAEAAARIALGMPSDTPSIALVDEAQRQTDGPRS